MAMAIGSPAIGNRPINSKRTVIIICKNRLRITMQMLRNMLDSIRLKLNGISVRVIIVKVFSAKKLKSGLKIINAK